MSSNFREIIQKTIFPCLVESLPEGYPRLPPPLREPLPHILHVVDGKCEPQVRDLLPGEGGEGGVICEMVPFVKDHWINCKLKTKKANTIMLLRYLYKICLILTGGLWQALANLYSGGRLIKGSRSQWPDISWLHYILQATPLWRRKSATATHVEQ